MTDASRPQQRRATGKRTATATDYSALPPEISTVSALNSSSPSSPEDASKPIENHSSPDMHQRRMTRSASNNLPTGFFPTETAGIQSQDSTARQPSQQRTDTHKLLAESVPSLPENPLDLLPSDQQQREMELQRQRLRQLPDIEVALKPQHNIPAFLNKLYNMVCDRNSNSLIRWSEDGTTFLVVNVEEFSKDVLPRFFKHNNFSSFVRQLNMYGFHKVPHLLHGGMLSTGMNQQEQWEFSHDYFIRNRPDLLSLVKRKPPGSKQNPQPQQLSLPPPASTLLADQHALTTLTQPLAFDIAHATGSNLDFATVLTELGTIRQTQHTIASELNALRQENQILWQHTVEQQKRHLEQQETVDKILRFLASVFSKDKIKSIHEMPQVPDNALSSLFKTASSSGEATRLPKKKRKLLLESGSSSDGSASSSLPIISSFVVPQTFNSSGLQELHDEEDRDFDIGDEEGDSDSLLMELAGGSSVMPPKTNANSALIARPTPTSPPSSSFSGIPHRADLKTPSPFLPGSDAEKYLQLENNINHLQNNIDHLTSSLGLSGSDISHLDSMDVDDFLSKYLQVDHTSSFGGGSQSDPLPSNGKASADAETGLLLSDDE